MTDSAASTHRLFGSLVMSCSRHRCHPAGISVRRSTRSRNEDPCTTDARTHYWELSSHRAQGESDSRVCTADSPHHYHSRAKLLEHGSLSSLGERVWRVRTTLLAHRRAIHSGHD